MDAATYERTIAEYPLRFYPNRDGIVEDMAFPPLRRVYRAEEAALGRPPDQGEFTRACIIAWPTAFPRALETAICARLARAYASLVRERHFGLLLREAAKSRGLVIYDSDSLDMEQGIDYAVIGPQGRLGIAVELDSPRSRAYGRRKATKRNGPVLAARLTETNRFVCGDFWLYRPEYVASLLEV